MPGNRRFSWASPLLRGGLVLGVIAAVMGLAFMVERPKQAEAAVLTAETAGVFKTKDKLLVTIGVSNPDEKDVRGTLKVELIDPKGKPISEAEQKVQLGDKAASFRFELPLTKLPADQVTLRCLFEGKQQFEAKMSELYLAKAHETVLSSGQEFCSGSSASLRCTVQGVKSLTETVPLAGAEVEIQLRVKDKKTISLYKGKAGANGITEAKFKMPAVPPGQYKMVVATKSSLGEEKLERDIKVKSEGKILLVTDKPLYQPGQLMHIRALALRPIDLTPVNGQDLTFEVEDAKGNKVFKRTHKTSAYGIASVDFQLADEVNMGDYQVRAILGDQQSQKTVGVKRYVLPKFKNELKAHKTFYLPKETIKADLQTDYFFGKPVAGAKVKVTASTFDVQFKEFQTWEGKTDAQGHAKFEIQLPDYFVGQPLQKGDAMVKLEAKVTDTADHSETIVRTYTVSDQPIRISLIPESGRLVPGMENHIFVAAIYPDGSPAACDVKLWTGREAKGKPITEIKTNDAGLSEFIVSPKAEQFRKGGWGQQNIEMLGGQVQNVWLQQVFFDVTAEAKDKKGSVAKALAEVNAEAFGENVLLRLDKAIYKGGDTINVDLRSSAGLPTAYLDVVRGGQTLLTHWLDVKAGKAKYKLDLPDNVFGTLEIHAYQMLAGGEIVRDSRVVYVQPSADLKIDMKADKDVYKPGDPGKITFQVTDAAGNPTAAALGVIIVDEAVYALQEMQPGLEKVYFTLQEELLKPQAQAVYKPSEPIPVLIQQPALPVAKQQIAQALLANVRPKAPARWEVDPAVERRRKIDGQIQQIGWAMWNYAYEHPFQEYDKKAKRWVFKGDLLKEVEKNKQINSAQLNDPFGGKLTLDALAKLDKGFTADGLARSVTAYHMQNLLGGFFNYTQANKAKWLKDGKWTLPATVLADAAKAHKQERWLKDAWGNPMKVVKRAKKWENNPWGWTQLEYHEIVSAGPDGKFGTDDDVKLSLHVNWNGWVWWREGDRNQGQLANLGILRRREMLQERVLLGKDGAKGGGFGGGGPVPEAAKFPPADAKNAAGDDKAKHDAKPNDGTGGGQGSAAKPVRLREYFPETMRWVPSLITDDKGRAELPLTFADSITTWRLSASASSKRGALGGVTAPLQVFQDFFVDLDLPIALTQNDEVAFPVAVYNYLKTPQTVKLDLQPEPWFELVEGDLTRSLDLKPNEVTAIKYRIRAKKIGSFPLTVKATGSKMSDAIKRPIEVLPDGTKVEQVVSDRLSGNVTKTITIPEHALADASKLFVKIYPGVFSQVLEGTEGMLRLPGG
jgi:hypothetical protein